MNAHAFDLTLAQHFHEEAEQKRLAHARNCGAAITCHSTNLLNPNPIYEQSNNSAEPERANESPGYPREI